MEREQIPRALCRRSGGPVGTEPGMVQRECNSSFPPPFMALLLHFQRVHDMDLAAWQLIDQHDNTTVQVWHTRQVIFRKKLLPDVRDDPMRGL